MLRMHNNVKNFKIVKNVVHFLFLCKFVKNVQDCDKIVQECT